MMKLSVFTVATPELAPEELAAAAKEAGLHGVEWRYTEVSEEARAQAPSYWGNNRCTIAPSKGLEEVERFKRAALDNALEVVSITPYLRAGDLAATEKVLEAARHAGAAMIRLGVPGYDRSRPLGELLEEGRAYLREAQQLCRKYGIKGVVEIHHGTIAASASGARRLVEGLDPEWVGVLFDPGNMIHEGVENYRLALEALGPYLAHVHVKNAGWRSVETNEAGEAVWKCEWLGLKEGAVPWRQVLADLLAVGYDGYLGVEDFSGQFAESPAMLRHFSEYIGGLLAELSTNA